MNYFKTLIATSLLAHVHAQIPIRTCFQGKFNSPQYQSLTGPEKLTQLWAQLTENTQVKPVLWSAIQSLFTRDMDITFDMTGDELPYNRDKINHAQGVVGVIKWQDLGGHNYTGMYDGNSRGIVRLSEGNFLLPEADGLTPTAAFKFFRDGIQSVNHLANTNWGPSGSYDFMANDFQTRLDNFESECEVNTIMRKFQEVTQFIGATGLSEFSRTTKDGTVVDSMWFPADMKFVPHDDVTGLWPDSGEWDTMGNMVPFYEQLVQLNANTTLFEVWAKQEPDLCGEDPVMSQTDDNTLQKSRSRDRKLANYAIPQGLFGGWKHIANIQLQSQLTTSRFGDDCLFFKHERLDQDLEERPELMQAATCRYGTSSNPWGTTNVETFPTNSFDAKAWARGQLHDYDCPFAWLLEWPFTPIY